MGRSTREEGEAEREMYVDVTGRGGCFFLLPDGTRETLLAPLPYPATVSLERAKSQLHGS